MARPESNGRMINKDISDDDGFAKLSPPAAVLFCLLIPHFNSHGKQIGGVGRIKDEVCPLIQYLTYENLPGYLMEISDNTSVKWFENGKRYWIHSVKFLSKHQHLRSEKLGDDKLPDYSGTTPGLVRDYSGTSPVLVPPEVEVEEEVEGKRKSGTKTEIPTIEEGRLKTALDAIDPENKDPKTRREVIQFIGNNSTSDMNAVFHCIESLQKKLAKIPEECRANFSSLVYLNAALRGGKNNGGEEAKANARKSEAEAKERSGPPTVEGMATLGKIIGGIGKKIPEFEKCPSCHAKVRQDELTEFACLRCQPAEATKKVENRRRELQEQAAMLRQQGATA